MVWIWVEWIFVGVWVGCVGRREEKGVVHFTPPAWCLNSGKWMWQWGPWAAADSLGLTVWPCMRVSVCGCVCMCHHVCVWTQGGRKWSTYETFHEHCSAKVMTPLTDTLTLAQAVCTWRSLFFCQLHHGWFEIRSQILVVAVTCLLIYATEW